MNIKWTLLIVILIIGGLIMPPGSPGESALSDAQKIQQVYRMYSDYKKDFPEVMDMTPQAAKALLKKDQIIFVDTRKPAEMRVSTLPAAITKKEFMKHPGKYNGKTVVTYCTISYRSGVFARNMAEEGITVYNLTGGILAWTLEGGKVYDTAGETKRIHVYGNKWDLSPSGYETEKFGFWEQIFPK